MKKFILVLALLSQMNQLHAAEPSECDGISSWKWSAQNSSDVLTRTCNLFGMNYVEVKSQLNENRCIVVSNTKTGDQWKHFFLSKHSIKALGTPYIDPENLTVASGKTKNGRCNS